MIFNEQFKSIKSAKIEPFKIKWNQETDATHLGIRLLEDNLIDKAVIIYALLDDNETYLDSAPITISEDYSTWKRSNNYPFEYVASKLNLTLIN